MNNYEKEKIQEIINSSSLSEDARTILQRLLDTEAENVMSDDSIMKLLDGVGEIKARDIWFALHDLDLDYIPMQALDDTHYADDANPFAVFYADPEKRIVIEVNAATDDENGYRKTRYFRVNKIDSDIYSQAAVAASECALLNEISDIASDIAGENVIHVYPDDYELYWDDPQHHEIVKEYTELWNLFKTQKPFGVYGCGEHISEISNLVYGVSKFSSHSEIEELFRRFFARCNDEKN